MGPGSSPGHEAFRVAWPCQTAWPRAPDLIRGPRGRAPGSSLTHRTAVPPPSRVMPGRDPGTSCHTPGIAGSGPAMTAGAVGRRWAASFRHRPQHQGDRPHGSRITSGTRGFSGGMAVPNSMAACPGLDPGPKGTSPRLKPHAPYRRALPLPASCPVMTIRGSRTALGGLLSASTAAPRGQAAWVPDHIRDTALRHSARWRTHKRPRAPDLIRSPGGRGPRLKPHASHRRAFPFPRHARA